MLTVGFFLFGIIAGLSAWWYFEHWRKLLRRVRLIKKTWTTGAGNVTPGLRQVIGHVRTLDSTLTSPFSRTPCVAFELEVQEQGSSGGGSRGSSTSWSTVVSDRKSLPFFIEDQTGRVLVDPRDAVFDFHNCVEGACNRTQTAPPHVEEALAKDYDFAISGFVLPKILKYFERCIADGDKVFVFGRVEQRADHPSFVNAEDLSLIISTKDEETIVHDFSMQSFYHLAAAIGLVILSLSFFVGTVLSIVKPR